MAQNYAPLGLGAKFSPPDHRDWQYMGLPYLAAPQNNDLRILALPVRNQGATSACTAFSGTAIRAALAAKYHISRGEQADLGDTLSPRFMYYHTRKDEDHDFPDDGGASMRGACQALVDFGAAPERYMPWDAAKLNDTPPTDAETAAQDYGVSGYVRLGGSGQALLASILSCLGDGYPPYIAIYALPSFMNVGSDGKVPGKRAGEKPLGGHALAVFGSFADMSFPGGGCFVVQNSWSEAWGQKGWCYMPWSYCLDGTLVEAWSIR